MSYLNHAQSLFRKSLLGLCITATTTSTFAASSKFSGSIEAEATLFPTEAKLEEQNDAFVSLALRPEYYVRSDNKLHKFKVKGFYRATEENGERSHGDIRELSYQFSPGNWYLKTGVDIVFWGVTESAHLVDVINQTDNLDSISGEEKLGQPMLAAGIENSLGNIDAYILPVFRTRAFTGGPERFRLSFQDSFPTIHNDENFYESDDEENHVDFALRWYKSYDDFDIGLSYFNGTGREPIPVVLNLLDALQTQAISDTGSYYQQQEQLGLEFQYLYEDWIIKLEATHQLMHSGDYSSAVAGFEYTFSDMEPWGQDIGVLVEYLWNDRSEIDLIHYTFEADETPAADRETIRDALAQQGITSFSADGESLSPMQNDLFIGSRFALNDIASSEFLAGIVYDLDDSSTSLSFEGSTRVGDNLRITANLYFFENIDEANALKPFEDDDQIEFKAEYFF